MKSSALFSLMAACLTSLPASAVSGTSLPAAAVTITPVTVEADSTEMTRVRELDEILESIPVENRYRLPYDKYSGPWVFAGYRSASAVSFAVPEWRYSTPETPQYAPDGLSEKYGLIYALGTRIWTEPVHPLLDTPANVLRPIHDAMIAERAQDQAIYYMMVRWPHTIDYAYWNLPVPPSLPDDDPSFRKYVERLNMTDVNVNDAIIPEFEIDRTHWLHVVGGGIQFSQAYVSSNWYQGGNDYLALLFNFGWDVQLNTVYHPDWLLQSSLSYKLGLNSSNDLYHKYSISEDLFQYNLKAGYKAHRRWYYSANLQFKTQMFNAYVANSDVRSASFLSPGDLTLGLGMTYSYARKPRIDMTVSLSPLSYNLKTCIDRLIDPEQFNITPGRKTNSEVGSSAEVNVLYNITDNISCKSRLFLFTDYHYGLGDLETTFNFSINRFLSTQLYVHLRYDSSSDVRLSEWRHWMLKEILSFGLAYQFTTKPANLKK